MFKLILILSLLTAWSAAALCQDIQVRPVRRHVPAPQDQPEEETHADDEFGHREAIFFNGGLHTEFYNAIQTDTKGTLRKFDYAPTIGMGAAFRLSPSWHFLPEINWVLPRFTDDSHIMKNVFMLRGDFGYDVTDWLRLHAGTSLMWLNIHGRGGKAKMNNGNTTSNFYYPSENRSALNNTVDLGAEIKFNEQWATRLQTYTYALFSDDRRQVSYSLFLTYYWKQ